VYKSLSTNYFRETFPEDPTLKSPLPTEFLAYPLPSSQDYYLVMEYGGSDTPFKPVEVSMQAFYQPIDIPRSECPQEEFVSLPSRVVDLITGAHDCRFGRAPTHLSDSLLGAIYRYHPQH
jgi:hypothetical protein